MKHHLLIDDEEHIAKKLKVATLAETSAEEVDHKLSDYKQFETSYERCKQDVDLDPDLERAFLRSSRKRSLEVQDAYDAQIELQSRLWFWEKLERFIFEGHVHQGEADKKDCKLYSVCFLHDESEPCGSEHCRGITLRNCSLEEEIHKCPGCSNEPSPVMLRIVRSRQGPISLTKYHDLEQHIRVFDATVLGPYKNDHYIKLYCVCPDCAKRALNLTKQWNNYCNSTLAYLAQLFNPDVASFLCSNYLFCPFAVCWNCDQPKNFKIVS